MRRPITFCLITSAVLFALLAVDAASVRPPSRVVQAQSATSAATAAAGDGSRERPLQNPCTGKPFTTVMTGAGLRAVSAQLDGAFGDEWVIAFNLANNAEARRFSAHTRTHIGQPFAIVLDGEVISAPVIQVPLTTGGTIGGNFTQESAEAFVLRLRSVMLPVSFSVETIDRSDSGVFVVLVVESADTVTETILNDAAQSIKARLDALGLTDSFVRVEDEMRISVDVVSTQEPDAIIEVVTRPALLEFVDFSRPDTCEEEMPAEGEFIVTDVQLNRRASAATATKAATRSR
jgi:preprotein translocase subunit SecD